MDEVARYASEQKQSVAEFQSDIGDSLTLAYLDRALFSGLTTPQILTKTLSAYLGESRTLNIARLTRTSVAEPKPPTEAQLQAFYTERSAVFAQPERRRMHPDAGSAPARDERPARDNRSFERPAPRPRDEQRPERPALQPERRSVAPPSPTPPTPAPASPDVSSAEDQYSVPQVPPVAQRNDGDILRRRRRKLGGGE
jgi:hypothetical protein